MKRATVVGLALVASVATCGRFAGAVDFEELLTQGEQAFLSGDEAKALELFEKAVAADPDRWEAYYYSGMVLQSQSSTEAAIEMYLKALEKKPDATEPLNNLAVAYLEAGELDKALASCDKALEADFENFEAAYNRGVVLEKMGKLDEAVVAYLASAELAPGDPDPFIDVAEIAFDRKDFAGAGKALASAFGCAPHQLELGLKALELLISAGAQDDASKLAHKLAKRMTQKGAGNPQEVLRVARSLRLLGDPGAALALLSILPADAQEAFSVQTEMGMCLLAMGECKKAAGAFDLALEKKPDSVAAKLAKADSMCCAHKWCKAKKAYKKFLETAPADHPEVASVKAKLEKGKKSCK